MKARDGEATIPPSAARAAFNTPAFRRILFGALISGTGTWMRMVVLGAFAYELTESSTFVGVMTLAQMAPFLLVTPFGGVVADMWDRRVVIISCQLGQAIAVLGLAVLVVQDDPSKPGILAVVLVTGILGSFCTPSWETLLPSLVPREHMAGAIALNSTQINLSRVVGPTMAGLVYHEYGAAPVFVANAVTYGFIIAALLSIDTPSVALTLDGPRGLRRIVEGVRVARDEAVIRRALVCISGLALLTFTFVSQMPTIAEEAFGIKTSTAAYGILYGVFGLGSVLGAFGVGTILSGQDLPRLVRIGSFGLGLSVAVLAVVDRPVAAYPAVAVVGFLYLVTTTALATVVQRAAPEHARGRVLSLYTMGLAGMMPLGGVLGGVIADLTSIRVVLLYGAVAGLVMSQYARLEREPAG